MLCNHHHVNKKSLTRPANATREKQESVPDLEHTAQAWTWWPTEVAMKNNLVHDIGFCASALQLFGATVYLISGFTSLPGIYDHLSLVLLNGTCWVPQIVGGVFFLVANTLFMIETQKRWYKPAFGVLGWHIGFWGMLGGVGFAMCPIFGLYTARWAQYQSSSSTF